MANESTDKPNRRRKALAENAQLRASLADNALKIQQTAASILSDGSNAAWNEAFDQILKLRKVQRELTEKLSALDK